MAQKKLNDQDVHGIWAQLEAGRHRLDVAKAFGVSIHTINSIKYGESHKHLDLKGRTVRDAFPVRRAYVINDLEIDEVRRLRALGFSKRIIWQKLGIPASAVSEACRRLETDAGTPPK